MRISIEYESSWRNSFLAGDNNSSLPKGGREYVGSMTALKKEDNFIPREVTKNTVMGLLNRLIGDQRKLYQARSKLFSDFYFFEDIESKVTFKDSPLFTHEVVYLRNMNGSTDQNSYTGIIKRNDPAFSSNYSKELWGVLNLDLSDLCSFIVDEKKEVTTCLTLDPLAICEKMEQLGKMKAVSIEDNAIKPAVAKLAEHFRAQESDYLNAKSSVIVLSLYCSALYLQLDRLSVRFDTQSVRTKTGGIAGISKRGFTKKDFMDKFTTGKKKIIWGNPYLLKKMIKGQGEVTSMLTKARGILEIEIEIDQEKGREIRNLIENAGVSSFYLGKKGLAFVSKITV